MTIAVDCGVKPQQNKQTFDETQKNKDTLIKARMKSEKCKTIMDTTNYTTNQINIQEPHTRDM